MSNQDEAKLVLEAVIQAARNAGVSKQEIRETVNAALAALPNNTYAAQRLANSPELPFLSRFLKWLDIRP